MKKHLVEDKQHFAETHDRWSKKGHRDLDSEEPPAEWLASQCMHCAYFIPLVGAFIEDWGACSNSQSPRDGTVMFEHDGCAGFEEAEDMWRRGAEE